MKAQVSPVVLDGGDRRCVLLLIELRRLIATLPAGTVVNIIATDPAAPLDLPAWCHLTGHVYLGPVSDSASAGRPTYAVEVSPAAQETDADQPWRPSGQEKGRER